MLTKILIVDDEPFNRAAMNAVLEGEGYHLHFAENGPQALALAHSEHPDLLLLDVMMPGMNGFEVTRSIRRDPAIGRMPIILVTSLDDSNSVLEGLKAGADEFLSKTCRSDELRARVRTVASLNRFRTIAEQRERFERLFELAPAAIVLIDANYQVVAANAKATHYRTGDSVFAPLDSESVVSLRAVLTAATSPARSSPGLVKIKTGPSETIYTVRAATVPEGRARLIMLVFDDVTAEVHAREALERLNQELESKVAARTRQLEESNALLMSYASFVSHDLRSPLTLVKGYLSMLREGSTPLPPEIAPLIGNAYKGAVMMEELIRNILRLAQDTHDEPEARGQHSVNPAPVIKRLIPRMRELYSCQSTRFEIQPSLPVVGVSAVLVERIFYNLVANAVKYSLQQPQPCICIEGSESPDGPILSVRDNGVGFDARDADKLFMEFSRLPSSNGTEGLGLGLSLVARLVRAQGGRIWAESAPNQGATFYVQLPAPRRAATVDRPSAGLRAVESRRV